MALRILHVTPYFADAWGYGGIPRVATALARELGWRGHAVTVCTTDAADARNRMPHGGAGAGRSTDVELRGCSHVFQRIQFPRVPPAVLPAARTRRVSRHSCSEIRHRAPARVPEPSGLFRGTAADGGGSALCARAEWHGAPNRAPPHGQVDLRPDRGSRRPARRGGRPGGQRVRAGTARSAAASAGRVSTLFRILSISTGRTAPRAQRIPQTLRTGRAIRWSSFWAK